jgi:hypothetical protein
LDEEYRSLSLSVCSFLHSPVTSTLVGPCHYDMADGGVAPNMEGSCEYIE